MCLKKTDSQKNYKFWWVLTAIFLFAMTIRILHIWQVSKWPFFSIPLGDAEIYHSWAKQIAEGDWLGEGVFYYPPLYAYLLALIYKFIGINVLIVRICHIFIGSLSCILLVDAGRRFFSKSVGVCAGLMLAIYAPAIFYDGLFHKTVVAAFFLSLALWLLSRLTDKPGKINLWLILGIIVGCMILTRENALVFVPCILIWGFVHCRNTGKQRVVPAAIFLLGVLIILLPVVVRNKVFGGQFHLTTSNFGRNLYIGNNEEGDGTYKALRFGRGHGQYELTDDVQLAEQAMGRKLTSGEVSRYWAGKAVNYIKSQPLDWLRLMGRKLALVLNATEIADTEDLYSYSEFSMVLRLAGFIGHFGVLAPLAMLGIWSTWHKCKKLWILYLLAGLYILSVIVFYVFGRYRYPVVLILILFASAGLLKIPYILQKRTKTKFVAIIIVIGLVFICNRPIVSKDIMRATTHINIGSNLYDSGNIDDSVTHYRKALQIIPNYAEAHNNLANSLLLQEKFVEAITHFNQALRYGGNNADVHCNLANAFRLQGRYNEAIRHYQIALQEQTFYGKAKAYNNLGIVFQSQQRFDEAVDNYYKALREEPDYYQAYYNLGNTFRLLRQFEKAEDNYRKTLQLKPDYTEARNNLAVTLKLQGKYEEAVSQFNKILQAEPDFINARYNLAGLFEMQNRLQQAALQYRHILKQRPHSAKAHYSLAVILGKTGQLDLAIPHFRQALLLESEPPQLLDNIAGFLLTYGNSQQRALKEAVAFAERAAELTKYQNAAILETLAETYVATKQFEDAISTLKKAVAIAANDNELKDRLQKQLARYYRLNLKTKNSP